MEKLIIIISTFLLIACILSKRYTNLGYSFKTAFIKGCNVISLTFFATVICLLGWILLMLFLPLVLTWIAISSLYEIVKDEILENPHYD